MNGSLPHRVLTEREHLKMTSCYKSDNRMPYCAPGTPGSSLTLCTHSASVDSTIAAVHMRKGRPREV